MIGRMRNIVSIGRNFPVFANETDETAKMDKTGEIGKRMSPRFP